MVGLSELWFIIFEFEMCTRINGQRWWENHINTLYIDLSLVLYT